LITTSSELEDVVAGVRSAGVLGLDTEFMREKTYRARLCLVQVCAADSISLIDPLARVDLAPLAKVIADPLVEVVIHAGKQDLEIFYERYGVVPANVFDVQLAAGFAGYGGSLPYGRLVELVTGARLEKGESYSDWCRRPLTAAQLRYAGDDVRYLVDVAVRLKEELGARGRMEWVRAEMRRFEQADSYRFAPEEAWRRVPGRGKLSGRQLAVLKEIARWREESARERDLPRGWGMKDPTLIEVARRAPSDRETLAKIRGFNAREVERSGDDIAAAVARGRKAAVVDSPVAAPAKSVLVRARMIAALADALVRARCEAAGLATELVVTHAELEALLIEAVTGTIDEGRHRLTTGWRREVAGAAVLALARGEIAVKAVEKPPYIAEVPVRGREGLS
jgi:ribonuclease D